MRKFRVSGSGASAEAQLRTPLFSVWSGGMDPYDSPLKSLIVVPLVPKTPDEAQLCGQETRFAKEGYKVEEGVGALL